MEIIVYTKPACVQCNATYRSLDSKGATYSSVDISKDAEALEALIGLGYQQAPVVTKVVDGVVVDSWTGFQPKKIAEVVEEQKALAPVI